MIARERDRPPQLIQLRRVARDQLLLAAPRQPLHLPLDHRPSPPATTDQNHSKPDDPPHAFALAPRSGERERVRGGVKLIAPLHRAAQFGATHNPRIGFAPVFTYTSPASLLTASAPRNACATVAQSWLWMPETLRYWPPCIPSFAPPKMIAPCPSRVWDASATSVIIGITMLSSRLPPDGSCGSTCSRKSLMMSAVFSKYQR